MVERVFQPAFQSVRLIPRHLLGVVSRNEEFLSLDVESRDGRVLFSTTPAYPDGPSNALNMPTLRGGLVVRAHLNPGIKDALIPGGIPPRIPVREIGLIGLSLALLLAIATFALRVGALARLRSDLASSVTHELRTPLTQIRLAAETVLLGRAPNPEAERRSLASIVDESKRLQQLIDNVLHFSRAERRLTRVHVEPVELRPVLERAAADLSPLVAGRGIELRVCLSEDLVVSGDANALRQIVINLLDNAARYGPDRQTITIGAERRDGEIELWVEDRGPGIPPAERKRVWQAFVRLERDRESVLTGTGLGLAVVRELVEAQGGRCWIEAAAGEDHGARVVIRLANAPVRQ
jgi:signal transduction histidine kinase